jgi:hypothetical protein
LRLIRHYGSFLFSLPELTPTSLSSSYIYFGEEARATQVNLPIYIASVPTEHLDGFNERFKASLERIASDGIDMRRMSMVINRDERQVRLRLLPGTVTM